MDEASFRCAKCETEIVVGKWYGKPFGERFTTAEGERFMAWLAAHEYHPIFFGRPSDDNEGAAFPDGRITPFVWMQDWAQTLDKPPAPEV